MEVKEFMKKSGIPKHIKGYEVLTMCIESHVKNPAKTIGELYDEVKEAARCTHWSVNRNISSAIEKGFPNMDEKLKYTLFTGEKTPTPAEYIKTVSCAIRNNLI